MSVLQSLPFWTLIAQTSGAVKLVMLVLLLMSVLCWTIIFYKIGRYRQLWRSFTAFDRVFWSGRPLQEVYNAFIPRTPYAPIMQQGKAALLTTAMEECKRSLQAGDRHQQGLLLRVEKALGLSLMRQSTEIFNHLGILASSAAVAPFVGLFGTVLGICNAFQAIGFQKNSAMGGASLAFIAPSIAEALLSTALGLLVAVPAVVAYNILKAQAGKLLCELEIFSEQFLLILSRDCDAKNAGLSHSAQSSASQRPGKNPMEGGCKGAPEKAAF